MAGRGEGRDGAVERLFHELVGLRVDERRVRLDTARPEVAAEVRALLASHDAAPGFLAEPAFAALLRDPPANRARGRRIGPYRILGTLGRGGMATVFEAVREHPRRRVALKLLNHSDFASSKQLARFEREADTLARLQHPGIATLYEMGCSDEGIPYIAMELVRGPTLDVYLRNERTSTDEFLDLFGQVCEAVGYANRCGIIHRDLKPGNVVVEEREGRLHAKVLDLGLARIVKEADEPGSLTASGAVVGTLSYSAPEQVSGDLGSVDARSDVYSLGVILYEGLTGALPYDANGQSILQNIHVVCEVAPRRPSSIDRRLRGDLELVVLKALEKDPALRYESAEALWEDVRRFLDGRPILARPPSAVYQLKRLVGRHRLACAMTFLLFFIVTSAAVTSWLMYLDARRAERQAADEAWAANEVNDFLRRTLSQTDPTVVGVESLGVRDLLDRTAERIDRELRRNTRVAAELRGTIGEAYAGLGDFALAEVHLRRALTTLRAVLSADDPELTDAQLRLGTVLLQRGDARGACRQLEEARRILDALPPSERQVVVLANLAAAVRVEGSSPRRFADGEAVLREALGVLDRLEAAAASRHRPRILCDLANLFSEQGRAREAEDLFHEALEQHPRGSVEAELAYATCLNDFAVSLGRLRRGDEAEARYREALGVLESLLGERHPRVAAVCDNLGDQLVRNGQAEAGETYLRRALAVRRELLRPGHPDVAVTLNHLGHALNALGRVQDARDAFEEALALNRERFGEASTEVANGEANLATLALATGDGRGAESYASLALEHYRSSLPPGHWRIGACGDLLGRALLAQGREVEAERRFRDALEIVQTARGEDDPISLRIQKTLAGLSADR